MTVGETAAAPEPPPMDGTRTSRRRRSRASLLPIVMLVVAFAAAGALYTFLNPVDYTAVAQVQVDATEINPNDPSAAIDDLEVATQKLVMGSTTVATAVVGSLQLDMTPTQLLTHVRVEQVNDSRVLRVTTTWDSPDGAASVSNAFAEQYLTYRNAQRDAMMQQLGATEIQPVSGGEVITVATPHDGPAGQSPAVIIALSAFFGLLLGIALVYLRRTQQPLRSAG